MSIKFGDFAASDELFTHRRCGQRSKRTRNPRQGSFGWTLKYWNADRHFGFISRDDGAADISSFTVRVSTMPGSNRPWAALCASRSTDERDGRLRVDRVRRVASEAATDEPGRPAARAPLARKSSSPAAILAPAAEQAIPAPPPGLALIVGMVECLRQARRVRCLTAVVTLGRQPLRDWITESEEAFVEGVAGSDCDDAVERELAAIAGRAHARAAMVWPGPGYGLLFRHGNTGWWPDARPIEEFLAGYAAHDGHA